MWVDLFGNVDPSIWVVPRNTLRWYSAGRMLLKHGVFLSRYRESCKVQDQPFVKTYATLGYLWERILSQAHTLAHAHTKMSVRNQLKEIGNCMSCHNSHRHHRVYLLNILHTCFVHTDTTSRRWGPSEVNARRMNEIIHFFRVHFHIVCTSQRLHSAIFIKFFGQKNVQHFSSAGGWVTSAVLFPDSSPKIINSSEFLACAKLKMALNAEPRPLLGGRFGNEGCAVSSADRCRNTCKCPIF